MSFPSDPQQGLIIVPAELWGPNGSAVLRLALDTGRSGPATRLISKQVFRGGINFLLEILSADS